jgi:hypothetical protein
VAGLIGVRNHHESLAIIIGATLIWLAAVVSPGPNFFVVSRLALSRTTDPHAKAGAIDPD